MFARMAQRSGAGRLVLLLLLVLVISPEDAVVVYREPVRQSWAIAALPLSMPLELR